MNNMLVKNMFFSNGEEILIKTEEDYGSCHENEFSNTDESLTVEVVVGQMDSDNEEEIMIEIKEEDFLSSENVSNSLTTSEISVTNNLGDICKCRRYPKSSNQDDYGMEQWKCSKNMLPEKIETSDIEKTTAYNYGICEERVKEKNHLQNQGRGDKKPYKCDNCGKGFNLKAIYQRHVPIHAGENPFKCEFCGKVFAKKAHFQTHIRKHTGEKPYQCDLCGKGFSRNWERKRHRQTHTGEKPYKCDICGRGFNRKENVNAHLRTHTGEKPFACEICRRAFARKVDMQSHCHTHTGERPYQCDLCMKGFTRKNDLKKHHRIHTGEKPFKCDICKKGFSRAQHLKRHLHVHTKEA